MGGHQKKNHQRAKAKARRRRCEPLRSASILVMHMQANELLKSQRPAGFFPPVFGARFPLQINKVFHVFNMVTCMLVLSCQLSRVLANSVSSVFEARSSCWVFWLSVCVSLELNSVHLCVFLKQLQFVFVMQPRKQ